MEAHPVLGGGDAKELHLSVEPRGKEDIQISIPRISALGAAIGANHYVTQSDEIRPRPG